MLLFTMDSIVQYGTSASKGGPAGEIIIRKALTSTLQDLNPSLTIDVAKSDEEMLKYGASGSYDAYVFDPWTWAGPGWKLRSYVDDPDKLYILDFFGSEKSYTSEGKGGGIKGFDTEVRAGGGRRDTGYGIRDSE